MDFDFNRFAYEAWTPYGTVRAWYHFGYNGFCAELEETGGKKRKFQFCGECPTPFVAKYWLPRAYERLLEMAGAPKDVPEPTWTAVKRPEFAA